jgi:pimeloyl-ACP methyl ester carboxylesterase
MNEIIDQLELEEVVLAGFSFGGLIILKTLIYDATKIKAVFLASPAYLVNGNPLKAMFKIFLPMRRYMKSKDPQHIERFLASLFTEKDDFAVPFLSQVFLHFDMDFRPVPVISKRAAKSIQTPITLIAAGKDLLFPGKKMVKRAQKIFPSLKQVVLLEDSKHVQDQAGNRVVEELIVDADQ